MTMRHITPGSADWDDLIAAEQERDAHRPTPEEVAKLRALREAAPASARRDTRDGPH